MPTVNDRNLVDKLIHNNGYYMDDDRIVKIVQYTSNWKTVAYGLVYVGQNIDTYTENPPYINAPIVLWEAK